MDTVPNTGWQAASGTRTQILTVPPAAHAQNAFDLHQLVQKYYRNHPE